MREKTERSPSPDEIRNARMKLGITQAQAGAIVYASWRTWQDWEYGKRRMSPATWELWQIKTGLKRPAIDRS